MKLEGKVAIVTGGGQGIGRGIAVAFAKEGATVVIADINAQTAKQVEGEVRSLGAKAMAVICDVGNWEDVKRTVERTVQEYGTVDILVNNAMRWEPEGPPEDIAEFWWDEAFRTGPKATWLCCKAALPYLKTRGGRIINFGSSNGILGRPYRAAYSASKEAIRGYSRALARAWGKYRINVNVICPTALSPGFASQKERLPDRPDRLLADKAIKRWGDPEKDIGRVAVFLASNDSDYMTGQTFMVEGGSHML